jgi:UDP-GlcNAc:undecaprenyl-phosphate GlcNAc-1-phosphate transferase
MVSLAVAMGISLLLCLLLVPLARALAPRLGLVDRPDGHRKIHKKTTPVSGGLAVLSSTVAAVAALLFVPNELQEKLAEHGIELLGLLVAGVAICVLGVADDYGRLRGRHKLAGQFLVVIILLSFGGWVHSVQLFGWTVELGWVGFPFTMFLMLGAVNSLNLIDGMDGLLGSVGVILSLALAAMALLTGNLWAATVAVALAGALIGFLRYNLPPATIFLGDSGSMFVGLVLGTLAVRCSLKGPAFTMAIAIPVALLILPIIDTAAAIIRRKLTGRSIYTTDRGHLHHCLLRCGYSTTGVLLIVAVLSSLTCAGVLASHAFDNEWIAVLTAGSIIAVLLATRLFGHAEAMLIKWRLLSLFSRAGNERHMEVRLQGSIEWKELWQTLRVLAGELNLQYVLLDVNAPALHEGYHARWDNGQDWGGEESQLWHAEIPVTARGVSVGRLMMAGKPDELPAWSKMAIVMKVIDEFTQPNPILVAHETSRLRSVRSERTQAVGSDSNVFVETV